MIVDDQVEIKENVKRLLNLEESIEIVAEASNGEEAIALVDKIRPDIVLIDAEMPGMDGFETTNVISMNFPSVIVIMMAVKREHSHLKQAMMAGAKDFLIKPFSKMDLISTIVTVFSRELRKRSSKPTPVEQSKKAIVPAVTRLGNVVTFFSIKGGVGKSIISSNMAIQLAESCAPKKTILLDFDLRFGDIGVILNQTSRVNITSFANDKGAADYNTLKKHIIKTEHGLDILLAPFEPQFAEQIIGDHLKAIIEILKKEYDYIIIDTPATINEDILAVLDKSQEIFMIVTQEITNIKGITTLFKLFETLKIDTKNFKLVINKYNEKLDVTQDSISRALNRDVAAIIPDDYTTIVTSINHGVPLVKSEPDSKFTRACEKLCRFIEPTLAVHSRDEGQNKFSFMNKIKSILGS